MNWAIWFFAGFGIAIWFFYEANFPKSPSIEKERSKMVNLITTLDNNYQLSNELKTNIIKGACSKTDKQFLLVFDKNSQINLKWEELNEMLVQCRELSIEGKK